jgi:hypothetical protein
VTGPRTSGSQSATGPGSSPHRSTRSWPAPVSGREDPPRSPFANGYAERLVLGARRGWSGWLSSASPAGQTGTSAAAAGESADGGGARRQVIQPTRSSSLTASIRAEVIIPRPQPRTSQLAWRTCITCRAGHQRRKPAGPRVPARPAVAERPRRITPRQVRQEREESAQQGKTCPTRTSGTSWR